MPLAELQRQVRDALIIGDADTLAAPFVGGARPARRFDIHRRHYEESLTAAVVGRFPATAWLIGPARLEAAARSFVHAHPPMVPCIAEYGGAFPGFLATWPETQPLTYVPAFADLDWHLGRLAVSVDMPSCGTDQLMQIGADTLPDAPVVFQAGTHYQHAPWDIDSLIKLYLADTAPESWTLCHEDVYLEVRGSRGTFRFSRLTAPDFAFRISLAAGRTFGDAAVRALELDPAFDPGAALRAVVDERLMTSIGPWTGVRS